MGFPRREVEALVRQSREPIQNVDQAIEIMFDPVRHNFYSGDDVADDLV
jgi:hypothetical protein